MNLRLPPCVFVVGTATAVLVSVAAGCATSDSSADRLGAGGSTASTGGASAVDASSGGAAGRTAGSGGGDRAGAGGTGGSPAEAGPGDAEGKEGASDAATQRLCSSADPEGCYRGMYLSLWTDHIGQIQFGGATEAHRWILGDATKET